MADNGLSHSPSTARRVTALALTLLLLASALAAVSGTGAPAPAAGATVSAPGGVAPGTTAPAGTTRGTAPDIASTAARDHAGWWRGWSGDADGNGLDDRLDAARGAGGEVPIYLVYDHLPDDAEVAAAEALIEVDYRARHIELLIVHHAALELVLALRGLPGVEQVRQQDQMVPTLDVSVRAIKARPSNTYRDQDVWQELGYDGSGINVAVLDTGVDDEHESLQGKFVAGYDATALTGDPNGGNGQTNPDDSQGHGTHVASTVMGDPPDGEYMGVAPGAGLIDVKVMTDAGASNSGYTTEGIDWCIEHKDDFDIRVLSMSFGSMSGDDDGSSAEAETVNRAVEAGLIAVVAVGNGGSDGVGDKGIPSPASADLAITVAASEDQGSVGRADDEIAGYSNYGPRADDGDNDHMDELKPEIAAPGTDITAACAISMQTGCTQNNQYTEMSGTSMATPHISGVIALMLEAKPEATTQQVEKALLFAAEHRDDIYDRNLSRDYNDHWGWGQVDAYRAVQAILGGIVEISIAAPYDGAKVDGKVELRGTAEGRDLEHVELEIGGLKYAAQGTGNWTLDWNSRDLSNGSYRVIATAYAADNLSAATEISLTVANRGPAPEEEDESFMDDIEARLDDLGGSAPLIGAAVGGVVVLALAVVGVRRWRRGREEWEW